MDKKKIENAVKMLLEAIGENPERPGIKKTPERYSRLCEEIFAGIDTKAGGILKPLPSEYCQDLVIVKDIPFYSMCEHHLMPFFGKVHVAYLPSKVVSGISKFPRIIDIFSKRLQVQERMTSQISDMIQKELKPKGVMVVVEAKHLCMSMRGVKKEGNSVVTISAKGTFNNSGKQAEILSIIKSVKTVNG